MDILEFFMFGIFFILLFMVFRNDIVMTSEEFISYQLKKYNY